MLKTTIERLKLNIATKPATAALVIYNENDLLKDINFLQYIEELFKQHDIETMTARLKVMAIEMEYIKNKSFLSRYYEHPLENHIVIFKDGELTEYLSVDKLEVLYNKAIKKFS